MSTDIFPSTLPPAAIEQAVRASRLRSTNPAVLCELVASVLRDHGARAEAICRPARFCSLEHPYSGATQSTRFVKEQHQHLVVLEGHLIDPRQSAYAMQPCTWTHVLANFHRDLIDPQDAYPSSVEFIAGAAPSAMGKGEADRQRLLGAEFRRQLQTALQVPRRQKHPTLANPFERLPWMHCARTPGAELLGGEIALGGAEWSRVSCLDMQRAVERHQGQLRSRQATLRCAGTTLVGEQHFAFFDHARTILPLQQDATWEAVELRVSPGTRDILSTLAGVGKVEWEEVSECWQDTLRRPAKGGPLSDPKNASALAALVEAAKLHGMTPGVSMPARQGLRL